MNNNLRKNINFPNYWNWNGLKFVGVFQAKIMKFQLSFSMDLAPVENIGGTIRIFRERNCASYSLDLIGFGDSDQPGIRQIGKLNNKIWCNQVRDFISQVIRPKNSGKVILIGNSLGSLVALTCAVSFDDQIATVIASPLTDQIQENKKSKTKKSPLKKIQDGFITIFFLFFLWRLFYF